MSGVPDSEIGRTQDTFRPTIPQPGGRNRRAGDRVCWVQISKGLSEEKGPCRVPHASEPYSGWMDKVVPPLGVTCRRAGWDGLRMMSILGWPNLGGHPKTNVLSRAELVDAVMRLQKELEEFRAEYGYGSAGRSVIPAQTSGGSRFTSTSVPMYAGNSSWGQCRL